MREIVENHEFSFIQRAIFRVELRMCGEELTTKLHSALAYNKTPESTKHSGISNSLAGVRMGKNSPCGYLDFHFICIYFLFLC